MDIKEAIRAGLQELILPELNRLKDDNLQIKTILDLTNKRLDDVNAHIVDQSRRIDALRTELKEEIHALSLRMDSMNNRLDNQSDRMDRMTEAMVRRDEQDRLVVRLTTLEHRFDRMEESMAA